MQHHRLHKLARPVRALTTLAVSLGLALGAVACNTEVDPADMELASTARVRAYFNNTGTRQQNGVNHQVDDMMVQIIDRARSTIDFAVMGFSRQEIIDALVRAHLRGVRLRFVGDGDHNDGTPGYIEMDRYNIPMMVGNQNHIMHNKFFVVDDRFVMTGTGNITGTGFDRNNNNYVFIDSPQVAADFKAEFEQMFEGRFSAAKQVLDNGQLYQVGDTGVEVFFSPQEDPMGRILQSIDEAQESLYFMIFAFTKDQIGSAFIRKHLEFSRYNRCCDPSVAGELTGEEQNQCQVSVVCQEPFRRKEVRGVVDRSQLHSNGPYHEVYRMLLFALDMRLDGNDNSRLPGDYQAGGGRLHSKTMIIDAGTPNGKVLTGSFNWSSSATIANDETFLVLYGQRVTDESKVYFEELWVRGKRFGEDYAGVGGTIQKGDVVFNEIHWDGWNGENDPSDFGGDDVYNDEFIELLNTTDEPIDLSMWTIGTEDDFVVGLYPGTIIGPFERFLLVDHNLAPFTDIEPQDTEGSAFVDPDFVMNTANDPRFLRLNLHNANFKLKLVDPRGNVIDVAGDGGPPFAGGRQEGQDGQLRNFSMERVHPLRDGARRDAWVQCEAKEGGSHVAEEFRNRIIATPGEPNSVSPHPGKEPEDFRAPTSGE